MLNNIFKQYDNVTYVFDIWAIIPSLSHYFSVFPYVQNEYRLDYTIIYGYDDGNNHSSRQCAYMY